MRGQGSALRLFALAVAVLAVTAVVLFLVPSGSYLLLPDTAHPVAPLVRVQGGHEPKDAGQIYFVDVFERRASVFESLFPWIRSGSTLVPAHLIVPPGVSDAQVRQADLRSMTISQQVAAAVALKRLGYKVTAAPGGVLVDSVEPHSHAAGVLQPGDIVVSVDGTRTLSVETLHARLSKVKPGQAVTLGIRRAGKTLSIRVRTIADPQRKTRALVGFTPEQAANIHLPLRVQIDAGNVGGPSAGLAFALQVMEELGPDVTHGYRVAATGEMELDGTVAPIGGVKQKTFGVRSAKADVFLVPAGDNYAEAKRYAHGLRVIAVKSFPQALRALATLPRKR